MAAPGWWRGRGADDPEGAVDHAATVKARLMKSAVKDERLVFETGAGTLDVYGAAPRPAPRRAPRRPRRWRRDDGYIYIQDTAVLWGSSWSQTAIWGGGKGRAYGLTLTPVPASITSGSGAIWGGRSGVRSTVDNPTSPPRPPSWGGGRSRCRRPPARSAAPPPSGAATGATAADPAPNRVPRSTVAPAQPYFSISSENRGNFQEGSPLRVELEHPGVGHGRAARSVSRMSHAASGSPTLASTRASHS